MAARVQVPIIALDAAGNPVSGASIQIVNRVTGQAPTVYQAETGTATRSLPLTTGADGYPPPSWVERAPYRFTLTAPAIGTRVLSWDAAPGTDASIDAAWSQPGQHWSPGDIKQTTRSTAEAGWIVAKGVTLARADYPRLWPVAEAEIAAGNAIYGPGDGVNTFTVADLSRKVLIGAGTGGGLSARAIGSSGGEEAHLLTGGESGIKAHAHGFTGASHGHGVTDPGHAHNATLWDTAGGTGGPAWGTGAASTKTGAVASATTGITVDAATAGGTVASKTAEDAASAHNNMQPYVTVNTLIKV